MVKIKVGKPTLQASDAMLADSQKLFRDQPCKPMDIPYYAVVTKTPIELIPMLIRIIRFYIDDAGSNTERLY